MQRKFAAAIPLLESALAKPLAITPRSHVLTTLGRCYDGLEQFERSLEYHDRALREDPLNYSAHVNKGVVYRLMGDYEKAAASYATALKMAPEYAELHSSLGTLAIFQSHFDQAVVHLERAVALNDSLAASHSNLALAYASVGRFDDADLALKKAVLRGYHQPEVVRLRIERLKAMTRTRRETDHIVAQ